MFKAMKYVVSHQYPLCIDETLNFNVCLTMDVLLFIQVMVFAKSYCPYCKQTRKLLMQWEDSIDLHVLDLDLMDQEDGALVQMELLQQTGQRTVPNSK